MGLYSPVIYTFVRKFGFDGSIAEDILQETMCQLVRYISNFDYDQGKGRFSTYLCMVRAENNQPISLQEKNSDNPNGETLRRF